MTLNLVETSVVKSRSLVSYWANLYICICICILTAYPAEGRLGSRTTGPYPALLGAFGASVAFETVPHGRLLATPPGLRPISMCRCRTQASAGDRANLDRIHCERQPASPLGTVSTCEILHRFPKFYTLRVEIFGCFFICSSLLMTPMNHAKLWKSVSTFFRNPECRHTDRLTWTDRRGNFIYIDVYVFIYRDVYVYIDVHRVSEKNTHSYYWL